MIEKTEDNMINNPMSKLDSAKAQLDMASQTLLKLVFKISGINQSMEQVRSKIGDFKPKFEVMNIQMLEEENQNLLSDKGGKAEYFRSKPGTMEPYNKGG